jgi:hypothetical protein
MAENSATAHIIARRCPEGAGSHQRFIASKNSRVHLGVAHLVDQEPAAASSSIGAANLRVIQIFCSSSVCVMSLAPRARAVDVERRVDALSAMRRSRWISLLPF